MQVADLARLSTRMFKTNPMRTWLTILGMGVGTGAVVVLVGLVLITLFSWYLLPMLMKG